jgi:DNA-binding XRE family transcriptional regulator
MASRLGFERTVVAKAESGERPPSAEVAAAYGKAFPHLDGLIERWAERIRKTGGSFPKFFIKWVDAEKTATALFYWAPVLVPGILQTEKYARTMLEVDPDDDEALEVRLTGRIERQQVLTRPKPPVVAVLLDETALLRCIGDADVMREQLSHLAEISRRTRIVPCEAAPPAAGRH